MRRRGRELGQNQSPRNYSAVDISVSRRRGHLSKLGVLSSCGVKTLQAELGMQARHAPRPTAGIGRVQLCIPMPNYLVEDLFGHLSSREKIAGPRWLNTEEKGWITTSVMSLLMLCDNLALCTMISKPKEMVKTLKKPPESQE